jgi:hypothetical protein
VQVLRVAPLPRDAVARHRGPSLDVDEPVPPRKHVGVVRRRHVDPAPQGRVVVRRRVGDVAIVALAAASKPLAVKVRLAELRRRHIHVVSVKIGIRRVANLVRTWKLAGVADGLLDAVPVLWVANAFRVHLKKRKAAPVGRLLPERAAALRGVLGKPDAGRAGHRASGRSVA